MAGFHWSDYLVFTASILVSLGVGIYHALAKGGQTTTESYLLGDRKMHFIPVAISLVSEEKNIVFCLISLELITFL